MKSLKWIYFLLFAVQFFFCMCNSPMCHAWQIIKGQGKKNIASLTSVGQDIWHNSFWMNRKKLIDYFNFFLFLIFLLHVMGWEYRCWIQFYHKVEKIQWKFKLLAGKFTWGKVHIFWEGHKILRNLPLTFDYSTYSQK